MTYPSTTFILARKALEMPAGRECVDWAVGMLVAGRDGEFVAMLASEVPPYNHFEIAHLRDRALAEVGVPDLSVTEAVRAYAAERLRPALDGEADLLMRLREIKDLCVTHDYHEALFPIYELYFAYEDLLADGWTPYWRGTPSLDNIETIVRREIDRLGA